MYWFNQDACIFILLHFLFLCTRFYSENKMCKNQILGTSMFTSFFEIYNSFSNNREKPVKIAKIFQPLYGFWTRHRFLHLYKYKPILPYIISFIIRTKDTGSLVSSLQDQYNYIIFISYTPVSHPVVKYHPTISPFSKPLLTCGTKL